MVGIGTRVNVLSWVKSQGEIADVVIITNDNPRTEDEDEILDQDPSRFSPAWREIPPIWHFIALRIGHKPLKNSLVSGKRGCGSDSRKGSRNIPDFRATKPCI